MWQCLIRNTIKSYKELPINTYQIQTKFRDEIRPRYGVMRSREFLMKDAYSFGVDEESLDKSYIEMRNTYKKILEKITWYRIIIGKEKTYTVHIF